MKVGILSDTHDQVERTRIAAKLLKDRGAKFLIHCGDITIADVVHELATLPTYFVFGNCDDDRGGLEEAMKLIGGICLGRGGLIEQAGKTIAVTHGDSEQELRRLKAMNPDFLCSGHTHQMIDYWEGGTRRINPGALHRAPFWSVNLLDLKTEELEVLRIERVGLQG